MSIYCVSAFKLTCTLEQNAKLFFLFIRHDKQFHDSTMNDLVFFDHLRVDRLLRLFVFLVFIF